MDFYSRKKRSALLENIIYSNIILSQSYLSGNDKNIRLSQGSVGGGFRCLTLYQRLVEYKKKVLAARLIPIIINWRGAIVWTHGYWNSSGQRIKSFPKPKHQIYFHSHILHLSPLPRSSDESVTGGDYADIVHVVSSVLLQTLDKVWVLQDVFWGRKGKI